MMLVTVPLLRLFNTPFISRTLALFLVLTYRTPSVGGATISRSEFCNDLSEFEQKLAEHSVDVQCQSSAMNDCYPYQQICRCLDDGGLEGDSNSTAFLLSCDSYIVKFPLIYFYNETARFELNRTSGIYELISFEVCECVTDDREKQCLDEREDLFYVLPNGFACSLYKEVKPCVDMSAHMETMNFPVIAQNASHGPAPSIAGIFWITIVSMLMAWSMS